MKHPDNASQVEGAGALSGGCWGCRRGRSAQSLALAHFWFASRYLQSSSRSALGLCVHLKCWVLHLKLTEINWL